MRAVEWAGEEWVALADRALWWPRRKTLCVADVHLGKAASFRSEGVPVPEGPTSVDLARLSSLISALGAHRLVVLGDLLHAASGMVTAMKQAVQEWRDSCRELDVLLIRGNHEGNAGDPPESWGMRVHDGPWADRGDGDVVLGHEPEAISRAQPGKRMLCGHIHPAAVLRGSLRDMKAPCFWFGKRVTVLPAFGSFTGTKVVSPAEGDRVLVVGPDDVVEVSGKRMPAKQR